MLGFCCEPGTYWNNKSPFWWIYNSYVGLLVARILQVGRFLGWLVAAIFTLVGTLILETFFPALIYFWTMTMAFVQFYIGLLMGTINIEVLVLLPIMLVGATYLLWLYWPNVGCWMEMAWPIFRTMLDVGAATLRMVLEMVNLGIRIWNSFVPIYGFFVYIVVEIQVQIYRSINLLIGEDNINALFDAVIEISTYLAQILIGVFEGLVSVSTELLSIFSTVSGAIITVVLESSPILLEQVNYLFRILPFTLVPITALIVKVVNYVKKAFFLARLLLEAAPIVGASLASTSTSPRRPDESMQFWRTFGEYGSRYWTPESARRNVDNLDRMSAWLTKNPPGTYSDYYVLHNADMIHSPESYYAGRAPLQADIHLPPEWQERSTNETSREKRHLPFSTGDRHRGPDPLYFMSHEQREHMYNGNVRLDSDPLEDSLHKRLPCRSRFCGGEGATVAHPMKTIASTHLRDRVILSSLVPNDIRSHRKRSAHAATLIYATRHAMHHTMSKHWRDGDGTLRKHVGNAWKQWTGHETFHSAAETWLSHHDDPMDSLATYAPVLSEMGLFRVILELHPYETQQMYYGRWAGKRQFFYAEVDDPYTGTRRKVVHITLNERNATAPPALGTRQLHQIVLGDDTMTIKEQPVQTTFLPLIFLNPFSGPGSILYGTLATGYIAGKLLEPALPVLHMLSKLNCYSSVPRHPWCIPEMPSQINCLLEQAIRIIPHTLPVTLCHYEEQCADIGFCIAPRPDLATVQPLNIVANRRFLISWCWVKNFFVWFLIAGSLVLPVLKLSFQIISVIVPLFGALIFEPLRRLLPNGITLQQSVCLFIYFYAPVTGLVIIFYLRFLWPLMIWLWNVIQGFFAMIDAIRGIEIARLAAISQEPWFEYMQAREDAAAQHTLHRDAVFGPLFPVHTGGGPGVTPYDPHASERLYGHYASRPAAAGYPLPPLVNPSEEGLDPEKARESMLRGSLYSVAPLPSISAEIAAPLLTAPVVDVAGMHISRQAVAALTVMKNSLEYSVKLFGVPHPKTTMQHVHDHEVRWHPAIHTGHYSWTWISRAIAKAKHEREKQHRRPPTMSYFKGLFHN